MSELYFVQSQQTGLARERQKEREREREVGRQGGVPGSCCYCCGLSIAISFAPQLRIKSKSLSFQIVSRRGRERERAYERGSRALLWQGG